MTYLNFKDQQPKETNFMTNNKSNVQLYSTQFDYQWKNEKLELESGAKYSFVKTNSLLDFSDNENGQFQYRPEKAAFLIIKSTTLEFIHQWPIISENGILKADFVQK